MTTYRAISDTEVAVDAPLTQQLMQALKDNVVATAEGSSGAPRVEHVALQGCDGTPAAGNYVINHGMVFAEQQGHDDELLFKFRKAGVYKVGIHASAQTGVGSNQDVVVNIYKSTDSGGSYGSSLHSFTLDASGTNQIDNDYDITFAAGDWVKIRATTTTGILALAVNISVADENAIFGVDCVQINNYT
jgi:hypothetical protein